MPSATFVADFSQFQAAVNAATISLKDFEGDANKVARSLDKMADTFSGATIRQQAALVQKAIEDIGGVTKLTAAEQAKANAVLEEALEKYTALGKQAPEGMRELAAATRDTDKEVALFATTLQTGSTHASGFGAAIGESDRLLNLVGIHTGPVGKAIEELGAVSGKTASEVGLLGTAGLAVGAAIIGWNIGRAIADFFELDKAIADTTSRLLGLGDVMAETAGAKADALARASQLVGLNITDMKEAVRLTTEALERSKTAFNTFNDEILRTRAPELAAERIAKLTEELQRLRQAGLSDDLAADIKSHNFSLKELSDLYRVSEGALGLFTRQLEASDRIHAQNKEHLERAAEAMRKWKEEQEKAAEAQRKMMDTIERGDQITTGFTAKVVSLGDALLSMGTKAQVSVHDMDAFVAAQERAQKALDAEFAASFEAAKAQDAFNAKVEQAPPILNETSDSMLRMTQVMLATAAGAYTFTSAFQQATAAADAYTHAVSAGNLNAAPGPMMVVGGVGPGLGGALQAVAGGSPFPGNAMPSFQSGGQMPHTGLAFLHAGETVLPAGTAAGGGPTIIVNVTQPLGTPTEIGRVVGEALTVQLKTLGIRQPWTG